MKNEIKTEKIKYFAYLRKSTEGEEKQALSIDGQRRKAVEIFPDLQIIEFLEERHSAFKPYNRPVFNNMMERIRKGEAQGIITWHPDRLSRNEIDAATITYLARTGVIKELKFGSYNYDNSPEGIMMLQMSLSQSQYSSSKLGKDVKRGLGDKAEIGWWPGPSKPGYLNTPNGQKGKKIILNDPERFPIIKKVFNTLLTHLYSPSQVLDMLNNDWGYTSGPRGKFGGKPMSHSYYYKMLSDTFYYGSFEFPKNSGKWYQGKHEPMISKEEYDEIQMMIGRSLSNPRVGNRQDAFYGSFFCGECGGTMTPDFKIQTICTNCNHKFSSRNKDCCPSCGTKLVDMINPKQLKYIYYCCKKNKDRNCKQTKNIEEKQLNDQIIEILNQIRISEKMKKWFIKQLDSASNKEIKDRTDIRKSLQNKYENCQKKLDNLLNLFISINNTNKEILSDDDYSQKKKALDIEMADIKNSINKLEQRADEWAELAIDTFNFACYSKYHFENGDFETKKKIILGLGSNLTMKDGKIEVILPKHLELIKNSKEIIQAEIKTFEPNNFIEYKAKTGLYQPVSTSMLPGSDSNRRPIG